jgi:hypothetical protein
MSRLGTAVAVVLQRVREREGEREGGRDLMA